MDKTGVGRGRQARYGAVFGGLLLALWALLIWNVNAGSVRIGVEALWNILLHRAGEDILVDIVWKIRLPRVCMSVILGGALALAGFLLQTFFGNPIAGPFVLGISSGAKLFVALTMICLLEAVGAASSGALILAAFLGAMLATGFILLLSRRVPSMSALLVGGIMIGYICSAATDFIITFAEDSDIVNLHGWSLGSFSGADWESVQRAFWMVLLVTGAVFLLSKPIGAYQLGEAYAQSVGVNIPRFRVGLILLSSLLSACVTAFAGPISFVGIAAPYLVKRCLGTARPLVVIPAVFLGGGVFCAFCDLLARTVFAPTELNISTVTAVLGAPVVIAMMVRERGRR